MACPGDQCDKAGQVMPIKTNRVLNQKHSVMLPV